jgi:hypothetical protein
MIRLPLNFYTIINKINNKNISVYLDFINILNKIDKKPINIKKLTVNRYGEILIKKYLRIGDIHKYLFNYVYNYRLIELNLYKLFYLICFQLEIYLIKEIKYLYYEFCFYYIIPKKSKIIINLNYNTYDNNFFIEMTLKIINFIKDNTKYFEFIEETPLYLKYPENTPFYNKKNYLIEREKSYNFLKGVSVNPNLNKKLEENHSWQYYLYKEQNDTTNNNKYIKKNKKNKKRKIKKW